jgi:tellurite resistance protein TerC
MTADQLTYLVFGVVLVVALVIDLGLLSKRSAEITLKKGFYSNAFLGSTCIWVFCLFMVEGK